MKGVGRVDVKDEVPSYFNEEKFRVEVSELGLRDASCSRLYRCGGTKMELEIFVMVSSRVKWFLKDYIE